MSISATQMQQLAQAMRNKANKVDDMSVSEYLHAGAGAIDALLSDRRRHQQRATDARKMTRKIMSKQETYYRNIRDIADKRLAAAIKDRENFK